MGNLRHAIGHNDLFFPLDNSAVFIASVTCRNAPFVYRFSCELDEQIYLPDLESALEETVKRYPFLKTELRPGLFWYYLDPLKKPLHLFADTRFPVEYHRVQRWGRYLFRVRVYGSRIACEFHHILTDGTGAVEFLKTLIAVYLTKRGVRCADWGVVRHPDIPPGPDEYEDSFARLVRPVPLPDPLPPAWRLRGRRYAGPSYRITTGTMPLPAALQAARDRGVSLTVLLAAVHLDALQAVQEAAEPGKWAPLCVQIPVNIRKYYHSHSMRNFFLFVPISIDRRLGHFGFDEILERVQFSLKLGLHRKELDRQIRRNVSGEQNPLARAVPLVIKNVVLRIIGRVVADKPYSGSISNMQAVCMPDEFAAHIRRFDFIPSRNRVTGANIGVVSWRDTLSVTVGSLMVDRSFERHFFSGCAALGIPVTVESNI